MPWTSTAIAARKIPVRPPIVNSPMNPSAYSIGVAKLIAPLYSVAVQLKTLMAEGTATSIDSSEKTKPAYMDWPLTNMWWPQTTKPMAAMATEDAAMAV